MNAAYMNIKYTLLMPSGKQVSTPLPTPLPSPQCGSVVKRIIKRLRLFLFCQGWGVTRADKVFDGRGFDMGDDHFLNIGPSISASSGLVRLWVT